MQHVRERVGAVPDGSSVAGIRAFAAGTRVGDTSRRADRAVAVGRRTARRHPTQSARMSLFRVVTSVFGYLLLE